MKGWEMEDRRGGLRGGSCIRTGKLLRGLIQATQQRRQSHKTSYSNPNS